MASDSARRLAAEITRDILVSAVSNTNSIFTADDRATKIADAFEVIYDKVLEKIISS